MTETCLTMMSKEEIEAEANEWIRSQGEETLPSDEHNQMVSAYVAGHYAGWNGKADDINKMGFCLKSDKEWHRNEVPGNEKDILCQVAEDDFVVGFYRPSKKRYYTTDGQDIDVIAWKEIIPPKQEE